ncbi:COG2426 family protein [Chlamydiota bacterium]
MKRCFLLFLIIIVFFQIKLYSQEEHSSIGQRIALQLQEKGISKELIIVLISTLPIVELRGAIPVAHLLQIGVIKAYFLAIVGNMIPVIPILLLIGPFSRWAMRFKIGNIFFSWLFARTRRKSTIIEKYETLGLSIFVAIPLPITGAWTGCVAAFLMGTSLRHSFLAILLGVMTAGIIMTTVSLLGWIGALIAGVALIGLIAVTVLNILKREEKDKIKNAPVGT